MFKIVIKDKIFLIVFVFLASCGHLKSDINYTGVYYEVYTGPLTMVDGKRVFVLKFLEVTNHNTGVMSYEVSNLTIDGWGVHKKLWHYDTVNMRMSNKWRGPYTNYREK